MAFRLMNFVAFWVFFYILMLASVRTLGINYEDGLLETIIRLAAFFASGWVAGSLALVSENA